jgi:hypothetical protein
MSLSFVQSSVSSDGTLAQPASPWLFGHKQNYGEGHARRIATTFDVPHMAIQRQLRRLEDAGALVSRKVGNTRVFAWNPRSAEELVACAESEGASSSDISRLREQVSRQE